MGAAAQKENAAPTQTTVAEQKAPTVDASSLGDVSEAILKCFHPTGRFRNASVVQTPWPEGALYNAEHSMLLRLDWNGDFTGKPYVTLVGVMERGKKLKAQVQADNAAIRANPNCSLQNWTAVEE